MTLSAFIRGYPCSSALPAISPTATHSPGRIRLSPSVPPPMQATEHRPGGGTSRDAAVRPRTNGTANGCRGGKGRAPQPLPPRPDEDMVIVAGRLRHLVPEADDTAVRTPYQGGIGIADQTKIVLANRTDPILGDSTEQHTPLPYQPLRKTFLDRIPLPDRQKLPNQR